MRFSKSLDDITGCTAASGIRERTTNQQRLAFVQHALYQRRAQGNSNQARRPHLNICWTILAPAHQEEHYGQKLWSQQQAKQEVLVSLGLVRSVAAAWWYAIASILFCFETSNGPSEFCHSVMLSLPGKELEAHAEGQAKMSTNSYIYLRLLHTHFRHPSSC